MIFNRPLRISNQKGTRIIAAILTVNLLLRLIIFSSTRLFYFSDFKAYLDGVKNIGEGHKQYLLEGNFLFGLSYLGYYISQFTGDISWFYVVNCLLGTLSSLILAFLVIRVSGSYTAAIFTIIFHTIYTEYMVFSSVFYSPVVMIFLVSVFLLGIFYLLKSEKILVSISLVALLCLIFSLTFFLKPELKYFPWFLFFLGLLIAIKSRPWTNRIIWLSLCLILTSFCLKYSNIISSPSGNVLSNNFVFFGHTDYGGDGGEGSFVYPENKARYDAALAEYCSVHKITTPDRLQINDFQKHEIIKFITKHPVKWVHLQITKFFRTFGVVPESTSFKVLYTGLLKGNLWLTSIIVVTPVALIIILFIGFFDLKSIRELIGDPATSNKQQATSTYFLSIYLLLFIYYLLATIFYGQYQERYRLTLMVVFIIPAMSYFISGFDRKKISDYLSLTIKSGILLLFLIIWILQTAETINNGPRFQNAVKSIEKQIVN
jgi:hypothetical protein